MAVAVGDLFEARVRMRRSVNEFLCVFHYRLSALGANPVNAFADAIETTVLPALNTIQHTSFYVSDIFVRDVFDDERFTERVYLPTQFDGVVNGDPLPDYVAVQYKSQRTRLDMRAGYKRVPGLVDDAQIGNDYNPAYLPALNLVATSFNDELLNNGSGYVPCIVKRIPYTAPSGKPAYRLPENQSEFVYSDAQFVLYPYLSTQSSRKVY